MQELLSGDMSLSEWSSSLSSDTATPTWKASDFDAKRTSDIQLLKNKMAMGDEDAKLAYARYLAIGDGVPADLPQAVKIFEEGAAAGKPAGKVGLAERYIFGDYPAGSKPDYRKAVPLIEEAANAGDPVARYWRATLQDAKVMPATKPEEILKDYEAAAQGGFLPASVVVNALSDNMAISYPLMKSQFPWFTYLAEHGVPKAATLLGVFYQNDYKRTKNASSVEKLKHWYEVGVAEGDRQAEQRLGNYYFGGVPDLKIAPDYAKAYELFQRAAKKDLLGAKVMVTFMDLTGKSANPITPEKAEPLLADYCKQGDSMACDVLGGGYYLGSFGFPKNREKALVYMKEACQLGSQEACNALSHNQ